MNRATRKQIFLILVSIAPEGILEAMLIPLYPFLVTRLLGDTPEVGYYTGLFSSAFYMPLFLMNIVWGGISDKYGRKVFS